MHIEEFVTRKLLILKDYQANYLENNTKDPESFPTDLGDFETWDEDFEMWTDLTNLEDKR